jgi:hypothetical protein
MRNSIQLRSDKIVRVIAIHTIKLVTELILTKLKLILLSISRNFSIDTVSRAISTIKLKKIAILRHEQLFLNILGTIKIILKSRLIRL